MSQNLPRAAAACLVLLAAASGAACSVILDFWQCDTQADCGGEEVCTEDNLCRPLLTERCSQIIGTHGEGSLLLGAVLSLSGRSAESGSDTRSALQLAIEQINEKGGVGGFQPNRPLALLVCDDAGDEATGVESASYLSQDVGVPAILGPNLSRVALRVAEDVALPSGTLLISPSATSVPLTVGMEDPNDLVWRTAISDNYQADTLGFITDWIGQERLSASGEADLPVAVMYASDTYGSGLSSLLGQAIRNQEISLQTFSYDPQDEASQQAAATQVLGMTPGPEMLILLGYEEASSILEALLAGQTGDGISSADVVLADGSRTVGLLSEAIYDGFHSVRGLVGTIPARGADDDLPQVESAYQEFFDAYTGRWGGSSDGLPAWTEQAYDATYLLALAAARVESTEVTGVELARALRSITDESGEDLSSFFSRHTPNMQRMTDGARYRAIGASGVLTMDPYGDRSNVRIGRWTVDTEEGNFQECGPAMLYEGGVNSRSPQWCNLRCMMDGDDDCTPPDFEDE